MAKKKFIRRMHRRHSKLGKRRKKKQIWRKPTGRDNKMREKRKGYPAVVSVGYRTEKEERGKINGKERVHVRNVKDLDKVGKNQIAVLKRMGKKKKIQVAKKAKSKGIEVHNLNVKKFLKKAEKKVEKDKGKAKKDKKEKQKSKSEGKTKSNSKKSKEKGKK